MSRSAAAAVIGALASLALAGCASESRSTSAPSTRAPTPVMASPTLAVEPLRRAAAAPPDLLADTRNPFRFGRPARGGDAGSSPSALAPLPPPDGLPMLPLPLAQPPLRLLGLLTFADGSKVAVISVGADLVMARTGETLASRFRLGVIGDDSVEITDTVGDRPIRLALP